MDGFKQIEIRNQTAQRKIPIPKINFGESIPSEFALVERVRPLFSLKDLTQGRVQGELAQKAEKEFMDFARATWDFAELNDAYPDNILYLEGRGWTLMDLDGQSIEWNRPQTSVRTHFSNETEPLLKRAHLAALDERRRTVIQQVLNGEKGRPAILLAADTYATRPDLVSNPQKLLKTLKHELQHTKLEADREILALSLDLADYSSQTMNNIPVDATLEKQIRDRLSHMSTSPIPHLNTHSKHVKTTFTELALPSPTPKQRADAAQARRASCATSVLQLLR